MNTVRVANAAAKLSCPLWCGVRAVRLGARQLYRWLAESPSMYRQAILMKYPEDLDEKRLADPHKLRFDINTYPPLYDNPEFAPWEEVADPEDPKQYNLISSSGGGVIRYSTSYCDWKIYECTGKHLRHVSKGRIDAKDWIKFLAENGYETTAKRPRHGHRYVGIIPTEGEFGLVVWLGKIGKIVTDEDDKHSQAVARPYTDGKHTFMIMAVSDSDPEANYFCSTYRNFEFEIIQIPHDFKGITWVQID